MNAVTDMFLFLAVIGRSFLLRNYQRTWNHPLPPVAVDYSFQMANDQRTGKYLPPPGFEVPAPLASKMLVDGLTK